MDDHAALREALKQIEHDASTRKFLWCWLTAIDAARRYLHLMEGAETVEWCLEHKALRCCDAHTDCTKNEDIAYNPTACRMVKADLHIHQEETV